MLNVRQAGMGGGGVTDGYEDLKDTFTATASQTVTEDIKADSGDIWLITAMAAITSGGVAGDSISLRLRGPSYYRQIDSGTGANAQVSTAVYGSFFVSTDYYLRIRMVADATVSTRTVTYWYQAVKLV